MLISSEESSTLNLERSTKTLGIYSVSSSVKESFQTTPKIKSSFSVSSS
jgi:hypothetical protein